MIVKVNVVMAAVMAVVTVAVNMVAVMLVVVVAAMGADGDGRCWCCWWWL